MERGSRAANRVRVRVVKERRDVSFQLLHQGTRPNGRPARQERRVASGRAEGQEQLAAGSYSTQQIARMTSSEALGEQADEPEVTPADAAETSCLEARVQVRL